MKFVCSRERETWLAVRSGNWSPSCREHARACPVCRDVALVASSLREMAAGPAVAGSLPDPRQIWWRALWLARRSGGDRATLPIVVYQRFAMAALLLGLAAAGAWNWPVLNAWLLRLGGEASLLGYSLPPLPLSVLVLTLIGIGGLFAYRAVFAED